MTVPLTVLIGRSLKAAIALGESFRFTVYSKVPIFCVPTGVISRTFQALGLQYGRDILGNLIDLAMPNVLTNSTLVTIFVGSRP